MKRSKALVFALIVLLPFMISCASGGNKKPTVSADKLNNVPADIPSQFLDRYERFITGKEQKEFKKLLTDEKRQVFIDKFWAERDSDPTTPENEYKQKIDDRIDDIISERFFSGVSVTGLLFRSNDGFRGDMAKVYLLHGEPDVMDTIEGNSFAKMMLWVYVNPENGNVLYAFLFYEKGNLGSYRLFPQDAYKIDPCAALHEVANNQTYNSPAGGGQGCTDSLYQVYNDISRSNGRGGTLDGNIFAWALFNFSQDDSILQGAALEPPKPASEAAKQSKARVTGEAPKLTGKAGTDYILASCEKCNSMMPAELQLGKEFVLSARRDSMDWRVAGDMNEVELKVRVVLENTSTNAPSVIERKVSHRDQFWKDQNGLTVAKASDQIVFTLLTADEVAQIPAGTYRVSIYVENVLTNKYNAWSKEFTK